MSRSQGKSQQELAFERHERELAKESEKRLQALHYEVEFMRLAHERATWAVKLESEEFKKGKAILDAKEEEARKAQIEAIKNHNKPQLDVDPELKEEDNGTDAE